ncbi:hypothetical protein ACK8P5_16570 [Paenibacillus sp. EC2-1]|uniref:hypothetical protein n=1 Tax=Paenibacillus sp. EC2-1 TaxID=3388665 RepID=UPI003BEF3129
MLKKKDWKELLQEFSDKVEKREQLIQSNINGLQEQVAVIQAKIKENSDQMIEFEMSEDNTSGVEKFKKENRKLRLELEEIQDSIAGYENQLGTSRDFYGKDLDKIRDAANKAEEERIRLEQESFSKRDALKSKIKEIEKQINEIECETIGRSSIEILLNHYPYLATIDPRAYSLKDHGKHLFIRSWLAGHDTEQYFKKEEVWPMDVLPHMTKIHWE